MPDTDNKLAREGISTRAIHLNYDPRSHQGALTPPVYMTSTYAFETAEEGAAIFAGERPGFVYGRTKNPTQQLLEERLASLEGLEAGVATASGMAAIAATMWTLLNAGDEVVIDKTLYGNTFAFFVRGLARFGVSVRVVDFTDLARVDDAFARSPKLAYFETPSNPDLRIIDIEAVCRSAKAHGVIVVVDNTFCSPVIQRPARFGADLVIHSATKYLGGHGDLLGGVVLGSGEVIRQIRLNGLRFLTGATMAPMTAFLILRGLKTLAVRIERHCQSALRLAEQLAAHSKVAEVGYPFLKTFAQAKLAQKQMAAGGAIIALRLKGGRSQGIALINALKLVKCAVSLGDAETLIQHPATMTHASYTEEERRAYGLGDDLVRISVGLEDLEDLIYDFEQALAAA